jgi:hypothetical protein
VTRLALELYVEPSPRFVRFVGPTLKLLGDNPDAVYYISTVHPKESYGYRVTGCKQLGREVYFSVAVHGPAAKGEAFQRVVADINDDAIAFDDDGCYAVILAPREPSKEVLAAEGVGKGSGGAQQRSSSGSSSPAATWLRLPEDALTVVTRHYFETSPSGQLNRDVQRDWSLHIEKWREHAGGNGGNADTSSAAGLTSDNDDDHQALLLGDADRTMATRLAAAADFVRKHTIDMPAPDPTTAPPFFSLIPNVIGPPTKWAGSKGGMGAVDIAYGAGRFLLKPDEVLVIRGTMPKCRFANVVLWNRFLQTFDYSRGAARPVSLNRQQLHLSGGAGEKEGAFTIVLAAKNPFKDADDARRARANWLYSEGRATGTVFFRFVLPEEGRPILQPQAEVVKADDVRGGLPR